MYILFMYIYIYYTVYSITSVNVNTKLVIEIFSFKSIHTRFISSLPFRSPGCRLGTFPTAALMDIALVGLEWKNRLRNTSPHGLHYKYTFFRHPVARAISYVGSKHP